MDRKTGPGKGLTPRFSKLGFDGHPGTHNEEVSL